MLSASECYYPSSDVCKAAIRRVLTGDPRSPKEDGTIADVPARQADLDNRWDVFYRNIDSAVKHFLTQRRYALSVLFHIACND